MLLDGGEYSCSSAGDPFRTTGSSSRRSKKSENKRRFNDEQIKSLETIFESETRLEPRKKLQLAKELGLQPRQVAIWFQNKRARWKSKQLERDYSILRANYNSLASKFETLKKEKQALTIQLQNLNDLMKKSSDPQGECVEQNQRVACAVNSMEGESENGDESEEGKPCSMPVERSGCGLGVLSDEDSSIKAECFGLDHKEEASLMSIVEPGDGSLTSQEDWGSLDSEGLFDQSNSGCQWWDYWV